jgi:hypothetical protein
MNHGLDKRYQKVSAAEDYPRFGSAPCCRQCFVPLFSLPSLVLLDFPGMRADRERMQYIVKLTDKNARERDKILPAFFK